jgi:hypothetical protein
MAGQENTNEKERSGAGFENPWSEMFKNMKPADFSNPQEFAKNLVTGITDFYQKSLNMNPFWGQATEAMKQNQSFFGNGDCEGKVAFITEINTIAGQMLQVIAQKQQQYLSSTFQQIVAFLKEAKQNQGNSEFLKQYPEKTKIFSEQATAHFSELSKIVMETSKKINDLLAGLCDDLQTYCDDCHCENDGACEDDGADDNDNAGEDEGDTSNGNDEAVGI